MEQTQHKAKKSCIDVENVVFSTDMDEPNSFTMEASASTDVEMNEGRFLMNHSVKSFSWRGLTVTVKDRQMKKARDLICDIGGDVQQGMYEALIETGGY